MANKLCEKLQIRFPIFQGGMGNISSSELTAAISEAGGLGTLGVGTMPPEEAEQKIAAVKELTDKPFAVNIPLKVTPYLKEMLTLAIQYDVPVLSLSAGNPAPYIPRLKEKGIKIIAVSSTVRQALKAEAGGADVIVAEGFEAAGINSPKELTTLTLIPQIVKAVSIPVVAAGGIADGKGLAAMLALGAAGVQMGTRFITVKEAPFHANYKNTVLEADELRTVIVGRSAGKVRRLLRTPYAEKLLEFEKNGISPEEFDRHTSEKQHCLGALGGDLENGFINGGQIAGYIEDEPTAAELLESMMEEAKQTLRSASDALNESFSKGGLA